MIENKIVGKIEKGLKGSFGSNFLGVTVIPGQNKICISWLSNDFTKPEGEKEEIYYFRFTPPEESALDPEVNKFLEDLYLEVWGHINSIYEKQSGIKN